MQVLTLERSSKWRNGKGNINMYLRIILFISHQVAYVGAFDRAAEDIGKAMHEVYDGISNQHNNV